MGDFFDNLLNPGGDERDAAAAAAREGALQGGSFTGPGGQSGGLTVGPDGRVSLSNNLGNLGPLRDILLQLAGGRFGASTRGVDPALSSAARGATQDLGSVPLAGRTDPITGQPISAINTGRVGSFDFANSLANSGMFSGLQDQLRGGVSSAISTAGQDPSVIANKQLGLLRQQAQPFEERAFSDLQDNLFSTGRSGTTGGGIQTEAFARGLGQADLQRQLSAMDVARGVQSDATGRATAFGGQLAGLRGLEDSLVNTAFGRALQGSGLNLGREQFNRQFLSGLDQFNTGTNLTQQGLDTTRMGMNANRAINRFGIAGSVLDSQLRNQVAQQGLGMQALQGVQGLDAGGMQNLMAILQAAMGRSNAQLGVASNLTGVANSATQAGIGTQQLFGDILSELPLPGGE